MSLQPSAKDHPYSGFYFRTLREAEWSLLQGPLSHEIRMRIEASSIISASFGFEYRYPLLYPKLLEFYLSLPVEQKRRHGYGRFLMRRYLQTHVPMGGFEHYQKRDGLSIFPATLPYFTERFLQGHFDEAFQKSPFYTMAKHPVAKVKMLKMIQAYMLGLYTQS